MSYIVKAKIQKDAEGWSASIPNLDLSTAGHKTLEHCLDSLTASIAWKVKEDFQSGVPITARVNAMAVRVEFEIDVDKNHTLEEFAPPERKTAAPSADPEGDDPESCPTCEHYSSKNTVKESCPRKGELLFQGGDKTGAQLIQDAKEFGCHGYKQKTTIEAVKESVKKTDAAVAAAKKDAGKLAIGSADLKKAAAKANTKKPAKKPYTIMIDVPTPEMIPYKEGKMFIGSVDSKNVGVGAGAYATPAEVIDAILATIPEMLKMDDNRNGPFNQKTVNLVDETGGFHLNDFFDSAGAPKKPVSKDAVKKRLEQLMEDPRTKDAAVKGLRAAADKLQEDALHAGDPCHACEGADRCKLHEPRDGCLDEILAADQEGRHEWEKVNLVTVKDKGGMHDKYKCRKCGKTHKCYGLQRDYPEFGCQPTKAQKTAKKGPSHA